MRAGKPDPGPDRECGRAWIVALGVSVLGLKPKPRERSLAQADQFSIVSPALSGVRGLRLSAANLLRGPYPQRAFCVLPQVDLVSKHVPRKNSPYEI